MTKPKNATSGTVETIHWPSLFAAISSISAVGIAIGLGLPLLSIILEQRGIPSTLIGLNTAMAGLASMAAAPLTTKLAHSFGVARTMLWAVFFSAVSGLGFYYAKDFWMWFPLRFVFHGASTTLFILSEFWINAAAPASKRGFVLGLYATVLSGGFAAGPLIFSLTGSHGVLPFAVGAFAIMIAAVPIFIARHESPVLHEMPSLHFFRYIWLVPAATVAVFVFGAVEAGGLALLPIYATRSGFGVSQAALLLTMMGIGNILFQLPLGLLSDRIKDRLLLLIILAVVGLVGSLFLPLLIGNWLLLSIMLIFFGGCITGLYTIGLGYLGSRLTGPDLAAANAAFIFCYAVGTVVGPQVMGGAMDLLGPPGFAWSVAAFFGLYVLTAVTLLIVRKKRP